MDGSVGMDIGVGECGGGGAEDAKSGKTETPSLLVWAADRAVESWNCCKLSDMDPVVEPFA
jgi:hypothetical protein